MMVLGGGAVSYEQGSSRTAGTGEQVLHGSTGYEPREIQVPFASRLPLPTETNVESGTSQSKR